MQLNKFTDYGLRILIYVSEPREMHYTIAELATNLQVSQNHLVKIVHFMSKLNWITTVRGKGGGLYLTPQTLELKLGEIVRILQGDQPIIDCNTPPCVLRSHCSLKGILDQARDQFYLSLNRYTLGEVLKEQAQLSNTSPISFITL